MEQTIDQRVGEFDYSPTFPLTSFMTWSSRFTSLGFGFFIRHMRRFDLI